MSPCSRVRFRSLPTSATRSRFRRSAAGAERQQLKWILYGSATSLVAVVFVIALGIPVISATVLVRGATVVLAAAAGVAILRYHLYDIDLVINRTLVYGSVTAILAAAFAGLSTAAQRSFETVTGGRSDFVSLVLGLTLVLGFVPLRRRIQPIVDQLLPARGLRTLLFTDIVGSTTRVVELGDDRWRKLLEAYRANVRHELARFGGREMDTAGDGFFATFDRTLQGLRCAVTLRESLRALGLDSRIGLHAGECELRGERVSGVNVVVAARVMAVAGANEIVASDAVRELAAGSDFRFTERGTHTLKGVPGEWRLQLVDA